MTEFQVEGLPCEHGLLWVENVVQFGVLTNENIECFVDTSFNNKSNNLNLRIPNMQEKMTTHLLFTIPKAFNEIHKNIVTLKRRTSHYKIHEINIQIYKKLVRHGIRS